jgi:hypothetical protein
MASIISCGGCATVMTHGFSSGFEQDGRQADHRRLAFLAHLRDGDGGRHARRAHEHVDLLLLDQLARVAARGGGVGGVVQHDQLHLAAADLGLQATAAFMPLA